MLTTGRSFGSMTDTLSHDAGSVFIFSKTNVWGILGSSISVSGTNFGIIR
jgi:hypothetical protein